MKMPTDTKSQDLFCDIFLDEYEQNFGSLPQQDVGDGSEAIDLGATSMAGFLTGLGYAYQDLGAGYALDGVNQATYGTFFDNLASRYQNALTASGGSVSAQDSLILNNLQRASNYFSESSSSLDTANSFIKTGNQAIKAAGVLGAVAGTLQLALGA